MLQDENCKLKGCLRRGWFIKDRKIRFPWWRKATSRGFFALSFVSLVCRGKIAFCRDENRDSEIVEFVEEPGRTLFCVNKQDVTRTGTKMEENWDVVSDLR